MISLRTAVLLLVAAQLFTKTEYTIPEDYATTLGRGFFKPYPNDFFMSWFQTFDNACNRQYYNQRKKNSNLMWQDFLKNNFHSSHF